MSTNQDADISFENAVKAVESLYVFRDHYFENHGLEESINKNSNVALEMSKTLLILDELKDQIQSKAKYLMLRGKTLNVTQDYSADAQEALAKAVKLQPNLIEAWNHLGECYWKKSSIKDAQNCFTGALSQVKNKISLRNLSMVLRQLKENRNENIVASVEKAKEAVQMDLKDGTSWFILGNAYLTSFFSGGQNPSILKQCMSAYQQAEKDIVATGNPDLHFNRAIAYKYQEEYELTLIGFERASALDPLHAEATEKRDALLVYLSKLTEFVELKGKLKPKRLQNLVGSLSENDLGPLKAETNKHITFNHLKVGTNKESVICGKVVCTLLSDDPVPFTFCMADCNEDCLAVTVYNIAVGYGVKIGDAVAIFEAKVADKNIEFKDKKYQFRSVRVESPTGLIVNGRKLGTDKQAPTYLQCSTVSE